jgi:hypothetical protein
MNRPRFVLDLLDLVSRAARMDDKEIDWLFQKYWKWGLDDIRTFMWWSDTNKFPVMPFVKDSDGNFDFMTADLSWDALFQRVLKLLKSYAPIRLIGTIFDECGAGKPWSPWKHNINGVHGIYGYKPNEVDIYLSVVERIWKNVVAVGMQNRFRFDLYNEGRCPFEENTQIMNEWAQKSIVPVAYTILHDLKCKPPIYYSASHKTANRISGWLTEPEYTYPDGTAKGLDDAIEIIHGIGLQQHWDIATHSPEGVSTTSSRRMYGYSEDGVDSGEWNRIPPELRGRCEIEKPTCKRCAPNLNERIKTAKYVESQAGPGKRFRKLHAIVYLPKAITMGDRSFYDVDVENSLKCYYKIAKRVYGVDIRRTEK